MLFNTLSLTLLASVVSAAPTSDAEKLDPSKYSSTDIIHRDVAIIGGGSSGTYSAISLKDQNVSSIVIEVKDRLGGHTVTYTDPQTGLAVDYGVVVFHNDDVVKNYFARFNISLATANPSAVRSVTYDYTSGKLVNGTQYTQQEIGAALQKYAQVIAQWPALDLGMFVPDPVPEDLTLTMGAFATKYGIEAAIPTMASFNPGLGDFISIPVLEFMRNAGLSLVQALQTGFLTAANGNNSRIYAAAQAELLASRSLLLNSRVTKTKRTDKGVTLAVRTPQGLKLVIAKKLLITIPAKLDYLKPFDLSKTEKNVFGKFLNAGYYASVVKNTGLPANLAVVNGLQNSSFNLPTQPGIVIGSITADPNLHSLYYAGPRGYASNPYSDEFVKSEIIAGIKKLQKVNPTVFPQSQPEFVAFSSHAPFYLQVRASEIKAGFYKALYALQGERSTYHTGASWKGHDSTALWKYSGAVVLPQLIQALKAGQ